MKDLQNIDPVVGEWVVALIIVALFLRFLTRQPVRSKKDVGLIQAIAVACGVTLFYHALNL